MTNYISALLAVCLAGSAATAQTKQFELDRANLEAIEERTEALANELLELSVAVRDFDTRRAANFFTETATVTALPAGPTESKPDLRWTTKHGWNFQPGTTARTTRDEIARQWDAFLSHFAELEDVRFKVKESSVDESGANAKARVYFYLVGRDAEGRREWVKGWSNVVAVSRGKDAWAISEMSVDKLDSTVATAELFSEVADPAGLAVSLPRFGEPGNEGFVWHGSAAGDPDRDGDLDLFVTGVRENFLYLNDGTGRFKDVAADAGVKVAPEATQPLWVDYDNDGDVDLFLSTVGTQMLFENRLVPDGKVSFDDVSVEAGVALAGVGFSAVAGDVNKDGLADIYVCGYNRYGKVLPDAWDRATNGTPNMLFVNQGGGRFRDEAKARGVADGRWSYAAEFADLDGDNDQDLYVANDYGEKGLYLNDGTGHFADAAGERGALDPGNGMGVSFGDYDNDGDLDLHVSNMSSTAGNRILKRLFPAADAGASGTMLKKLAAGNSLLENDGSGHFREVTSEVGGFGAGWAWGGGFVDFDNDGWEDLYSGAGFVSGKSMKDT
jgi:hypothetical protein